MPHFSESGADMYICQVCGRDLDSEKFPPQWRPDLTGSPRAGNICPSCLGAKERLIDLREHCRRESGLTGPALDRYINRHYGHG